MEQQAPNLSRDEIKLLIEAGDITIENIGQLGLTKSEAKTTMTELMIAGKGPLGKMDIPTVPGGTSIVGAGSKIAGAAKKGYDAARVSGRTFFSKGAPKNVEKLGKEEFANVGRTNVTKSSPMDALKSDDHSEVRKILFGGLNSAKDNYVSLGKGPLQKTDILQMGKNIKETSKAGSAGVTRRKPK